MLTHSNQNICVYVYYMLQNVLLDIDACGSYSSFIKWVKILEYIKIAFITSTSASRYLRVSQQNKMLV